MRRALSASLFAGLLVSALARAQSSEEPDARRDLRVPEVFGEAPRPPSDDLRVPDIFRTAPPPPSDDLRVPDIFRTAPPPPSDELRVPDIFRAAPRPPSDELRVPDIFLGDLGLLPASRRGDLLVPEAFRDRPARRLGIQLDDPAPTGSARGRAHDAGLGRALAPP